MLEATFRNLFSLFLVGSKSNVLALFWLRFNVWFRHYTSFFLMGSKSDVSAFFWLRLGNGFGTKPAGALLFRMRSRRSFLGLCLVAAVSQWLGHDFIVFRGSKSDVSAFFWLRFHNGFGTKPAGVLLFRMHVRNTFFLSLAWWLAGFQVLRCAVPCLRQPAKATFRKFSGCGFVWFGHYTSFFLFSGFQKRRFGIFLAAVSQWLRHKTCWGSAFSHARPKHLFLEFGLVACRLPSLTLRCALLEATFRNLFSLFLVGSKSNVLALFWLRFRMVQALYFFLFLAHYTSFFLMGSKSDVSAFFWLRLGNGFGTKPAGGSAFSDALPTQLSWALPGGCSFAVAGARFHCF